MKFLLSFSNKPPVTQRIFVEGGNRGEDDTAVQAGAGGSSMPALQTLSMTGGGNLLDQVGNLQAINDNAPLVDGRQESGSGILPAETAATMQARVNAAITQGGEGAQREGLSNNWKTSRFTPENFRGIFAGEKMFLNPLFWGQTIGNPKEVQLKQTEDALKTADSGGSGSPLDQFQESPLVGDMNIKAMLKGSIGPALNAIRHSGGGDPRKFSLTSLEYLEGVFTERHRLATEFLAEQESDFLAKANNEVFWKQWLRILPGVFQKQRYELAFKAIERNERVGFKEIMGIIQGLKQDKVQETFKTKEAIDNGRIGPENAADTVYLNARSSSIRRILHHPEAFIKSPSMFETPQAPLKRMFGVKFNPLTVLEVLTGNTTESKGRVADNDLDKAALVNQWQFSHFNALRTLQGLDQRAANIAKIGDTNLNKFQLHIDRHFERSNNTITTDNPRALVNRLILALGSGTPGLLRDLNKLLVNGDIYMDATEIFWGLANFFGKNLRTFDRLPPELKQEVAQFLYQKRDQMEESLVSGGINEPGTLVWRAVALNQGSLVLTEVENLRDLLPSLGENILSLDKNVANQTFQKLKSFLDAYGLFSNLIGKDNASRDTVLSELPEIERQILQNIIQVGEFAETIQSSYDKLFEQRRQIQEIIDQNPDWVEDRKAEYARKEKQLETVIAEGRSGFENTNISALVGLSGGGDGEAEGASEGAGGAAPAGLETLYTALRNDLQRLDNQLNAGEDGGAIGKMAKIENFPLELPGNVGDSLQNLYLNTKRVLKSRLQELGLNSQADIASLYAPDDQPKFELLARLDMGRLVSQDILKTGQALVGNDAIQQFKNMHKAGAVTLNTLVFAEANYQTQMTLAALNNRQEMHNALFVRIDEQGAAWYHTRDKVIRITPPQLQGEADQRNMAIWHKAPHEQGLNKKFTVAQTQPDSLGIFLTANPENKAAANNELYGTTEKKIAAANRNYRPGTAAA